MRFRPIFNLLILGGVCGCSAKAPPPIETPEPKAIAAPAPSVSNAAPSPNSPSAREEKQIAQTLERVSLARQLKATRPIPGITLQRDALLSRVRKKIESEVPAESIVRDGHVLELMGIVPAGFDYFGETMKLLESQLGGFYDPATGEMVLAGDLSGPGASAALSHELVHALQDQHWDLKARTHYRPGESDTSLALSALAEGDATSAMMDVMIRAMSNDRNATDVDDDTMAAQLEAGMDIGVGGKVPHVLKMSLAAPYIEGMRFVHSLRRAGGWAEVDRAWDRSPTTTEQILHPEKWRKNEPPISVPPPSGAALGEGWANPFDDTVGEIGLSLAFGEWIGAADGKRAASDWGGDRLALFESGEKLALAMHLRYDANPKGKGEAFSARAFQLLAKPAGEKRGETKRAASTSTWVCFEREALGPFGILRKENDLIFVFGPATASKKGWRSASTCAEAKVWATTIAEPR